MPDTAPTFERRMIAAPAAVATIETRDDDDAPITIKGYAAVFYDPNNEDGTTYRLYSDMTERIERGAFDDVLAGDPDTRALFNHSADMVIGRTASGTLRLAADDVGLRYEVDLPDTSLGRDLAVLIKRGDITGSSFGFRVEEQSWLSPDDGSAEIRVIKRISELYDVSPVTFPAYQASTVSTRSAEIDQHLEAAKRPKRSKKFYQIKAHAASLKHESYMRLLDE